MQAQSPLPSEKRSHNGEKWLLFVILVGVVLGLDQGTKQVVHTTFRLYESRPVTSFLNLTYVRNPGAAFGLLSRRNPVFIRFFFLGVTFVALVILLCYYARVPGEQKLTLWGLGLISSGALGNGIDRLWLGQVIDFIDVYVSHYHWPAFNVADSAICVGVGCLLLDILRPTGTHPLR